MVFDKYSQFYDAIYSQKNYSSEILFIKKMANIHAPASILDLGCGTGRHDLLFAKKGFRITGIDFSEGMIKQAIRKINESDLPAEFQHGDIRSIRLNKTFDLVISLFAVMSYQTTNADFEAALSTARAHLEKGSFFIFDAWYGPAVLKQKPENRTKRFQTDDGYIIRNATPELDEFNNKVTVHYKIQQFKGETETKEIKEAHSMRYFFAPEVAFFANKTGLEVIKVCPFLDPSRLPDESDWNVTWMMRAA
jgi:SAM-dependent methyltransferase